jgi:apolipoprotein N-acyltransferase
MPLIYAPADSAKSVHLRLVQANVGNFMKVQSENGNATSTEEIYQRYKRLSTLPTKEQSTIDLIVWPETAYPSLLNTAVMRVSPALVPAVVQDVVTQMQAPLLFGGYDQSENQNTNFYETEYNAAFLISKRATLSEVYHKRLLIPFGESLPFGFLNPYLARIVSNISFFAKGERFPVFKLRNGERFISVICYEILFSGFIRSYLNHLSSLDESPHFLINLTNDSWYGDTSEPYQHQFLSHWRSLEFQIPMVRMTNTGITSILYPDGSQSERLDVFQNGILDINLKVQGPTPTFFQRWGFLPTLILTVLIFFICWLVERFRGPL